MLKNALFINDKQVVKNEPDEIIDDFINKTSDLKNEDDNFENKLLFIEVLTKSYIGLKNLGNTCYMNSALQIIIHINDFISSLNDAKKNSINIITNSLFDLCKEIFKLEKDTPFNPFIKTGCIYFNPIKFKEIFALKHPLFREGHRDSMELLDFY